MPSSVLSRRGLFGLGAMAAAGLIPARAPAATVPQLKIGLASYSMRKQTLDQVIALCRELEIRHLTLKEMHLPLASTQVELDEARGKLGAAGIALAGVGVLYMKSEDEVRRAFTYARAAGAPLIVGAPNPELIDVVEATVKEMNLPIAIHNHGPEDKHYPSPREILAVIKKRDRRLGVCMDVGHTVRAGVDPIKCVAELGPRLFDLHLKDLKDISDRESRTEVGRGVVDNVGLLRVLAKRKFTGHLALEYEINPADPAPGIRESLAYLRGAARALGA